MFCNQCGTDVDGPGCNSAQAKECINNQPKKLYDGEVPDTDAYYADDDRYT